MHSSYLFLDLNMALFISFKLYFVDRQLSLRFLAVMNNDAVKLVYRFLFWMYVLILLKNFPTASLALVN